MSIPYAVESAVTTTDPIGDQPSPVQSMRVLSQAAAQTGEQNSHVGHADVRELPPATTPFGRTTIPGLYPGPEGHDQDTDPTKSLTVKYRLPMTLAGSSKRLASSRGLFVPYSAKKKKWGLRVGKVEGGNATTGSDEDGEETSDNIKSEKIRRSIRTPKPRLNKDIRILSR